jgi:haloacetate dehalogenase
MSPHIRLRCSLKSVAATRWSNAWFFLFHGVRDLPEALITGREEIWLRHFFSNWTYNLEALTLEDVAIYTKAYAQPGALRGALEDYRAWRTDLEQDEVDAQVKISCPTLALWGAEFEVAKKWDMVEIWRQMADNLTTVPIPKSGHLPHEERPEEVNQALLGFLQNWT